MSFKALVLKALSYLSTSLVFSVIIIAIGYYFFGSPKERILNREVKQYELQFNLINERLEHMQAVLNDLADRDDNIYRVIFEAEPIPSDVRKAGYGGSDRYSNLEGYRNSDLVINTVKKLDEITAQLYVQSKSLDEVYNMAKNTALLLSRDFDCT